MWVGSESYEAHRHVMESGKPLSVETDSAVLGIPVEVNIFPRSTGLSVYFRDVSARRRMEKELRERDEIGDEALRRMLREIDLRRRAAQGAASPGAGPPQP